MVELEVDYRISKATAEMNVNSDRGMIPPSSLGFSFFFIIWIHAK